VGANEWETALARRSRWKEERVKIDVPLSIPEEAEFPQYANKDQLGRWIWRHIQIPLLLFLVTTLKEGGIPHCEVNS
jgi:hypothetical protein